jgi:elongator complex protein 6
MTSNSRIPPLLAPYILSPPKGSLILLTNTLGTSANWLVLRYICGALDDSSAGRRGTGKDEERDAATVPNATASGQGAVDGEMPEDISVVLVSWMRDYEFWRTEARRAGVSLMWKLA